jgi:hypothetical protein
MADRTVVVPLTDYQREILALLAQTRSPDSYLAGGAALHFSPNSTRYSHELNFFHDSSERVAEAFAADSKLLETAGAARDRSRDQQDARAGRRNEPRDFVDILFAHERILPLAGLTWAAVGKDTGFSPHSILELLKRRGRLRPEDVARLDLAEPFDLAAGKETWRAALEEANTFARSRPANETGCLYYSLARERFVLPEADAPLDVQGLALHWGRPGGILPRPVENL